MKRATKLATTVVLTLVGLVGLSATWGFADQPAEATKPSAQTTDPPASQAAARRGGADAQPAAQAENTPSASGESELPAAGARPKPATGFRTIEPEIRIVPFLGTATTEATPAERGQAGLPEGVGLTVQEILAGSPAEAAGLKQFDVLHKLGDQLLVNDPQFRTLLRMHRPGERIDLHVIRRGRPVTVSVELGRREVPVGELSAAEMLQWLLRPAPRSAPAAELAGFSARYEDAEHVLLLSTDPQGKHLLARDKQGNVLFDGQLDTPQQRAAVPDDLLSKLEQLENPPQPRGEGDDAAR